MKNFSKLILPLLLCLAACATRKEIVTFKNDSAYMRTQIDSLRAEQKRLRAAMIKLAAITEQSAEANNRLRADLQLQMNQLAEQTQLLTDRLEETGRRISNLPAKLRLATPPASTDTTKNGVASDTAKASVRTQLEEAQKLYDAAYQDFVKGQYQLAQQGFAQYLQLLPESELADNAQYWIGECYYSQKKYSEAIQAFQTVIARYPEGEKAPAAMLKLGYAQITSGQTKAGQETLEKLIKRFPQTNEARLARSRLQELKN